jgi:hypothetical protein
MPIAYIKTFKKCIKMTPKNTLGGITKKTKGKSGASIPSQAKIQKAIRALGVARKPRKKVIDPALHKDIMKLKQLKVIPDRRKEYLEYKRVVRRRYCLSETTIDNELRKDMPGYYRANSRCSRMLPIADEEKRMVEELFAVGMQQQEMMRILSNHLGIAYGKKRLNKVRDLIALDPSPLGAPSAFDNNMRTLFYGFCKLDLSDPMASHDIQIHTETFRVNTQTIKDSLDLIIYSAEEGGKHAAEIAKLKMQRMLLHRYELIERGQYIPTEEMKQLELIRNSLNRSDTPPAAMLSPDMRVMIEVFKELAPAVNVTDIVGTAAQLAEKFKGTTIDAEPYIRALMGIAAEEAAENM